MFSYLLFISAIQQTPLIVQEVINQQENMSLIIAFTVLLCVACIFFIIFSVVVFRCRRRSEKAGETNVIDSVITYRQVSAKVNTSCFLFLEPSDSYMGGGERDG